MLHVQDINYPSGERVKQNQLSSERAKPRFKQKVSRDRLQASLVQAPSHKVSSPRRTTAFVSYTAKVIRTVLLHAKKKLTTRPCHPSIIKHYSSEQWKWKLAVK